MDKSAEHPEMGVLPTVGQFPIRTDQLAIRMATKEDGAAAVPVAMAPATTEGSMECKMKYSQSCSSIESVPREEPEECPAVR